jgi:arsenate reductase
MLKNTPRTGDGKARVLFLCIGNSCRSPMAEGLATKYGSDVLFAQSAGLMPIHRVDPLGVKVMRDRNIDISNAFPKGAEDVDAQSFDLIVNMSGQRIPALRVPMEEWKIPDPIGQDETAFRKTADLLEQQVMRLVLQLRLNQHPALKR